jgi:hypothetical protein
MLGFKMQLWKTILEPYNAIKTAMSDNSTTKSLERPHQTCRITGDVFISNRFIYKQFDLIVVYHIYSGKSTILAHMKTR